MSAWKRKSLALFPNFRKNIERNFSTYDFWSDFLPLTQEAHRNREFDFLKKIYGFAEWCINEKSEDLWNAAALCFYKHLLNVKKTLWPEILPWISDDIIYEHNIKGLWNYFLGEKENEHLEYLLRTRKETNSRLKFCHNNMYTTGEIQKF